MRNVVRLTLLAAVLSFIPLQEARAVSSNSGIWYFEATNEEWAVAESIPDYNEYAYYDIVVDVWISAEGVGGAGGQGGYSPSYPGIGYAHAEAVLPHYPHAEYELWSDHVVTPYVSDHTGSIWYDYYGYSSNYNDPYDPVVCPLSYYFAQGGTQQVSFTSILLGHLIAVASGGMMHGPPHHLRVVEDRTFTYYCGEGQTQPQPVRQWKFKVVDSQGRNAGRVHIKERFNPSNITTSCSGEAVTPTNCGRDHPYENGFYDTVSPGGCLPNICGFTIDPNEWRWCPRGRQEVVLALITYEVYTNGIWLNGQTNFAPGFEIY